MQMRGSIADKKDIPECRICIAKYWSTKIVGEFNQILQIRKITGIVFPSFF